MAHPGRNSKGRRRQGHHDHRLGQRYQLLRHCRVSLNLNPDICSHVEITLTDLPLTLLSYFARHRGYAEGNSEVEMGRVLHEMGWQRSDYIISTKIFFGTGRKELNSRGLSRKHLVEGLNYSLKRLGLDYVDVVFAHRPDTTVPMEETVRAFDHLVNTGKAFYWG